MLIGAVNQKSEIWLELQYMAYKAVFVTIFYGMVVETLTICRSYDKKSMCESMCEFFSKIYNYQKNQRKLKREIFNNIIQLKKLRRFVKLRDF